MVLYISVSNKVTLFQASGYRLRLNPAQHLANPGTKPAAETDELFHQRAFMMSTLFLIEGENYVC